MKPSLLLLALLALIPVVADAQIQSGQVDLTFTFGTLATQNGVPIPDGSLIQIIALTSGTTFSTPTATSFVGNNSHEVILFSGAMDSVDTTGIPGAMVLGGLPSYPQLVSVPVYSTPGFLQSGDPLLLQWFPALTATASNPGTTSFGQFGFPQDPTWVVPTLPTTNGVVTGSGEGSYVFLTSSLASQVGAPASGPDALGFATGQTAPPLSSVPEPSTYGIAATLSLIAVTAARKRSRVSS